MDTFTGFKFQFEIRGFLSGQDGLERGIGDRGKTEVGGTVQGG